MTWVIGACPMLGAYAITVSDIQITLRDGRTFDLVRKAYGVGPYLIAGFAGSVFIGFELLSSISDFLRVPPGTPKGAWDPAGVARDWGPIARNIFERCPEEERKLGSEFVLVGPHPVEEVGIPGRAMPYLCRFSAPEFKPEITRGGNSAISIGSGAEVPQYVEAIKDMMDPYANDGGFLRLEVDNTGGWANGINIAISLLLDEHPAPGISQHVHTHVASREGFRVMTSNRTINLGTPEEKRIEMPRVANSFAELLKMADELGIAAASAVA